jgi:hypothetical protein
LRRESHRFAPQMTRGMPANARWSGAAFLAALVAHEKATGSVLWLIRPQEGAEEAGGSDRPALSLWERLRRQWADFQ